MTIEGWSFTQNRPLPPIHIEAVDLDGGKWVAKQWGTAAFVLASFGKGKQFNAEDYVFFSIKGNPVDPRGFVRQFHTLLKQLDIPRIAFHDLRHSTSSILELLGVPLRTRMAILGHSDYRTGLKYTHVMPGTLKKDLEKIGKLLTRMDDETIDVDEFIENCRKTVVNGGV